MRSAIFPTDNQDTYDAYQYSAAIKSDPFLFVSGQVGVDKDGAAVLTPLDQFKRAFDNLQNVLLAATLSWCSGRF